jgi:hypothetical protein
MADDDPYAAYRLPPEGSDRVVAPPATGGDDPYAAFRVPEGTVTKAKDAQAETPQSWAEYAREAAHGVWQGMKDQTRLAGNAATFGQWPRVVAGADALTSGKTYDEALDNQLNMASAAKSRLGPFAAGTAEAAGGLLTGGLPGVARSIGTSTLARVGGGLVEGGLLGAAQGAGNTYSKDASEYAKNALMGGIFGGGVGAAAPIAGTGAAAVYRGIADRGWFGGVPGKVANAASADARGLAAVPYTEGAMIPDAGPSMQGIAQGAVIGTGGPGRTKLVTNLKERDTATPARITGFTDTRFGPAETPSYVERGIGERMQALGPEYERVLNNARAVDTRPVADWLDAQIVNSRGPAQAALRQARDMLNITGNPGQLDPHPRVLQQARTAIQGMATEAERSGNGAVAGALGLVDRQLTQELQARVPGIRELDHAYAELGAQQRAIGTAGPGGQIFAKSQERAIRPTELADAMVEGAQPKGVNVGPSAESFRFRQAARSELDRIVGTNKNDLLALENALGKPQDWNAQKLGIMFGQDKADALMEVINRERMFRDTYHHVVEGSQTAQRTAAAKELAAGQGAIPLETSATGLALRGIQEGARSFRRTASANTRDRVAEWMATQEPQKIQDLVDTLLATKPTRDVRQSIVRSLVDRGVTRGGAAYFGADDNRGRQ